MSFENAPTQSQASINLDDVNMPPTNITNENTSDFISFKLVAISLIFISFSVALMSSSIGESYSTSYSNTQPTEFSLMFSTMNQNLGELLPDSFARDILIPPYNTSFWISTELLDVVNGVLFFIVLPFLFIRLLLRFNEEEKKFNHWTFFTKTTSFIVILLLIVSGLLSGLAMIMWGNPSGYEFFLFPVLVVYFIFSFLQKIFVSHPFTKVIFSKIVAIIGVAGVLFYFYWLSNFIRVQQVGKESVKQSFLEFFKEARVDYTSLGDFNTILAKVDPSMNYFYSNYVSQAQSDSSTSTTSYSFDAFLYHMEGVCKSKIRLVRNGYYNPDSNLEIIDLLFVGDVLTVKNVDIFQDGLLSRNSSFSGGSTFTEGEGGRYILLCGRKIPSGVFSYSRNELAVALKDVSQMFQSEKK